MWGWEKSRDTRYIKNCDNEMQKSCDLIKINKQVKPRCSEKWTQLCALVVDWKLVRKIEESCSIVTMFFEHWKQKLEFVP